jgi:hypothetical protein
MIPRGSEGSARFLRLSQTSVCNGGVKVIACISTLNQCSLNFKICACCPHFSFCVFNILTAYLIYSWFISVRFRCPLYNAE